MPENSLVVRSRQVRGLLDKMQGQIAMALPRHCTAERMIRVGMTAIQRTPKLLECSDRSLLGAIVECSQLGLEPDGILGHAYLVPFKNRHTQQYEAQLIPGYKGLIDLARRSGQLSTIFAQTVRQEDEFDFEYGLEPALKHRPTRKTEPGPIIAFYAVAHLRDGGRQFKVMWKREVDAIRGQSKASKEGPWVTHYEAMGEKTCLRQLCKLLPCSVELQKAVTLDELAESGIPQSLGQDDLHFGAQVVEQPDELDALAERMMKAPSEPAYNPPTPAEQDEVESQVAPEVEPAEGVDEQTPPESKAEEAEAFWRRQLSQAHTSVDYNRIDEGMDADMFVSEDGKQRLHALSQHGRDAIKQGPSRLATRKARG